MRLYHVIVVNERTGSKTYFSTSPVTHEQGCAWLAKITNYKWRRKQLEEA